MASIVADNTFKCIFLNENDRIPIQISQKFVPSSPIDNKPALVQAMAWRRTCDKPLPEPMLGPVPWRIYAALRRDELTALVLAYFVRIILASAPECCTVWCVGIINCDVYSRCTESKPITINYFFIGHACTYIYQCVCVCVRVCMQMNKKRTLLMQFIKQTSHNSVFKWFQSRIKEISNRLIAIPITTHPMFKTNDNETFINTFTHIFTVNITLCPKEAYAPKRSNSINLNGAYMRQ